MKRHVIYMLVVGCALALPVMAQGEPYVYDEKGKQDPFLKLVSASGAIMNLEDDLTIGDMVLEGVMADVGGNVAIINGNIVKESDRLGEFTVMKINKDSVFLEKNQERFILKNKKEE